jgi:crotonobetainyl-CoA:carnitine CoA-transferase CaiB-like acyl-CoA transferase
VLDVSRMIAGGVSGYITLNLTSSEGLSLLQRLVPRFDVVIESFVRGQPLE